MSEPSEVTDLLRNVKPTLVQAFVEDRQARDGPSAPDLAPSGRLATTEVLAQLSERWRSVLWMTEIEGRSPAELAAVL